MIKQLLKRLSCKHEFRIDIKDITYHIIEDTNKTKIKCSLCGLIKDYQWHI